MPPSQGSVRQLLVALLMSLTAMARTDHQSQCLHPG